MFLRRNRRQDAQRIINAYETSALNKYYSQEKKKEATVTERSRKAKH